MTKKQLEPSAAEMTDFDAVLAAYQVLLDGWVDSSVGAGPYERPAAVRSEVERCLFRCITRQAFTHPAHLESLDFYGITLSTEIIPGAVDRALTLLAPLALNLDPRTARWRAESRGNDTFEWIGRIQELVVGTRLEADGDGWRVVVDKRQNKAGGVYYTPACLVDCLLESALDPLLERALVDDDPEAALLALTVCDPSCGSGHFLVAAARRIARRVLQVRVGGAVPTLADRQAAMRDVVRCCIYAVDLDPMSVELTKICLWLEEITGVHGYDAPPYLTADVEPAPSPSGAT